MSYLLLVVLATYQPPVVVLAVQDTGYDHCNPMTEHWHQADDSCYRDSDDSRIQILPKVPNEKL
jgi:hypothetical protein